MTSLRSALDALHLRRLRRGALPLLASVASAALLGLSAPASANAIDQLQTMDDIGINKVPNRGTSHVLVIPVRALDPIPAFKWEELQTVYDPAGGPGTFRSYYQVQSRGVYDPIPTLLDPVMYNECPVDSLDPDECRLDLQDITPLINGDIRRLAQDILERVRDEQGIDFRDFDINSKDCPVDEECPDGFFDGVVFDTNLFGGIAFPLAALNNAITVNVLPQGETDGGPAAADAGPDGGPGDTGPTMTMGIVALVPPHMHEFAHNLGFIDHYNSRFTEPELSSSSGLMAREGRGLSAYSRIVINWGESMEVAEAGTYQLAPVLEGGAILRIGGEQKYLLIENRAGAQHDLYDEVNPGIYIYHIDERQLPNPDDALAFIDVLQGELYYPNLTAPYLNVNIPFSCQINSLDGVDACEMVSGDTRNLDHLSDGHLGFHLSVDDIAADGTAQIRIIEGRREDVPVGDAGPGEPEPTPTAQPEPEPTPEPEVADGNTCGCGSSGMASVPLAAFGLLLGGLRRRRRTSSGGPA